VVKVRAGRTTAAGDDFDLAQWLNQLLPQIAPDSLSQLLVACETARSCVDQPVISPDDWSDVSDNFNAGLDMVQILADLHLGTESLLAGALYRSVCEGKLSLVAVEEAHGQRVAELITGVQRMSAINVLNVDRDSPVLGQADAQKENVRKMLVSLVDDVRVALIKLAERTCAIRAVKEDTERRIGVARQVFEVYAPLAHRLGIGHLKWELEDLSFRYLYQDSYHRIARLLDGRLLERDQFIERVKAQLSRCLKENGISGELSGRPKHIYSIWRKMHDKQLSFDQVFDLRAVRILVDAIGDCYSALGVVHGMWMHVPQEFDDYKIGRAS